MREIVPDGYAAQEDQAVTVTEENTADNPATVTFVNVGKPCLKIVKTSEDGNVAGITFQIFKGKSATSPPAQTARPVQTVTTGDDGTVLVKDLSVPAYYWVREVVPEGYQPQNDQVIRLLSSNTPENPATVTFTNKPLALKIIKQSSDGNISGISFQIFAGETDYNNGTVWKTVTTGLDGSFTILGIPAGDYWFREIVPQGYAAQADQKVTVTDANTSDNPAVVTFANKRLDLKIIKQSSDGNVSGISFQVFSGATNYSNGTVWKTVTTGSDGSFTIEGIPAGDYWVREIVPDGYVAQADQKVTVTDANTSDNPAVVTFINQPMRGSITVNKTNDNDVPLAGAIFLLEYSTDNGATWSSVKPATEEENGIGTCSTVAEDGTLTTGEDGQAVFDELIIYGVSYRVSETKAPEGFQLLAEPVFTGEIEADNDGNYEICRTVVNMPVLQIPPAGGDGSVRLLGALSVTVAAVSLLVLGLMLKRRKSETEG